MMFILTLHSFGSYSTIAVSRTPEALHDLAEQIHIATFLSNFERDGDVTSALNSEDVTSALLEISDEVYTSIDPIAEVNGTEKVHFISSEKDYLL